MHEKFYLIGVAIVISAVLMTRGIKNKADKENTMVNVMVGMWVVVFLVLYLIR